MDCIAPQRSVRLLSVAGLLLASVAGEAAERMVHTIRIHDFAFEPARLEIRAGDAVMWTNDDLAPHTATGGDPDWDTGPIARAQSRSLTFAVPGTFAYHCLYHSEMRGEIVVLEPSAERPASQPPTAATAP